MCTIRPVESRIRARGTCMPPDQDLFESFTLQFFENISTVHLYKQFSRFLKHACKKMLYVSFCDSLARLAEYTLRLVNIHLKCYHNHF